MVHHILGRDAISEAEVRLLFDASCSTEGTITFNQFLRAKRKAMKQKRLSRQPSHAPAPDQATLVEGPSGTLEGPSDSSRNHDGPQSSRMRVSLSARDQRIIDGSQSSRMRVSLAARDPDSVDGAQSSRMLMSREDGSQSSRMLISLSARRPAHASTTSSAVYTPAEVPSLFLGNNAEAAKERYDGMTPRTGAKAAQVASIAGLLGDIDDDDASDDEVTPAETPRMQPVLDMSAKANVKACATSIAGASSGQHVALTSRNDAKARIRAFEA